MSQDKTYKYEVLEEAENPLETKLVKRSVDVEFTMQQMLDYENAADKQLIELIGKIDLEDAKMKNVVEHHDDAIALVRDLDPIKQNAIHIWLKSKEIIDVYAPKRDELRKAIDEHKAEIKSIKEQTGWEPPTQDDSEDKKEDDATEESSGGDGEQPVS
jgi:hypothetical protein